MLQSPDRSLMVLAEFFPQIEGDIVNQKNFFALAIITLGLFISSPLLAQFSGDYAVANWEEILLGSPPAGGGEVDLAAAPASIQLLGGDDGCDFSGGKGLENMTRAERLQGLPLDEECLLLFVIELTGGGTVSFQWDYETLDIDGPSYDVFGYVLNGDFVQLSDDDGPDAQSGLESIGVNSADEFGFYIDCTDCGEGPASVQISQFTAPAGTAPPPPPAPLAVPVNSLAALALLALLLAGLGTWAIRAGR